MIRLEITGNKFPIGRLVATAGVSNLAQENPEFAKFMQKSLNRHVQGDWGDLDAEDKNTNEQALKNGERLFSAYTDSALPKIWIITEWDRSATTILFPEEY